MARRLTTEEFIERAKKVHGDKYNYSKVEYKSRKSKIIIDCPEHGEFLQISESHLKGSGCPACAGNKKLTTKEFIERAKKVHGDKYNYSKVEYKSSNTKVTVICPVHGEFQQRPADHLNGAGCLICANKKLTTKEFIEKAKKVHGDKYVYSKVEYKNGRTKVNIICWRHGNFKQDPLLHLKGVGCPKCNASNAHLKNIQDLKKDFLKENFLNEAGEIKLLDMMNYFNIKETSCYKYMRELGIKINYKSNGFNPQEPGILYYIFDPEANLYKIGITNRSIEERFGKAFCSKRAIAILEQTYYENGYEALEAESEILEAFSYARTINESWPEELGGRTEFFNGDILHKHNT
jgi:Zn finger protein HypA/HybF involved in hydrogenase expression